MNSRHVRRFFLLTLLKEAMLIGLPGGYAHNLHPFDPTLAKNSALLTVSPQSFKMKNDENDAQRDKQMVESLILSNEIVIRNQFFLLAGWLNRKEAILAVPYEYYSYIHDRKLSRSILSSKYGFSYVSLNLQRLIGELALLPAKA